MDLQTKKKVLASFFLSDMNMCACCVYVYDYDYHLILSLSLLLVSKDRICHCCACMDVNACFFFTLAILCDSHQKYSYNNSPQIMYFLKKL